MKAIQNVSQLFSFSILFPVQSFSVHLGKSAGAFMLHPQYEKSSNEQCVHFEGEKVLTAASAQIPNAGV